MNPVFRPLPLLLVFVLAAAGAHTADAPPADYRESVEEWRKAREARLKAEGGWLSVAGLFWLKEGTQRFGSAPDNELVFPAPAPARAGTFELKAGQVTVQAEPGAGITTEGRPVTTLKLLHDKTGRPSVLNLGPLTFFVIERHGQYGIRLKDPNAATRRDFKGLQWFPIDPALRITARFVPHAPAKQIPIPDILGKVENLPSPGYAEFTLGGRTLRLEPVLEDPKSTELFYIFKDTTSARTTYGAGRFLYSELPKDGQVVLDFNKAYSPPCAFTAFATCPLPPPQNRLPVAIAAGEKKPLGH